MGGSATTYLGWKIYFKSAYLKGVISTNGKAQSILTHVVDNLFSFSIYGLVDFYNNKPGGSNFGVSISIGGG